MTKNTRLTQDQWLWLEETKKRISEHGFKISKVIRKKGQIHILLEPIILQTESEDSEKEE